jgi:hypothetical protein
MNRDAPQGELSAGRFSNRYHQRWTTRKSGQVDFEFRFKHRFREPCEEANVFAANLRDYFIDRQAEFKWASPSRSESKRIGCGLCDD